MVSDHLRITVVFETPGPNPTLRSWKTIRDPAQLILEESLKPEEYDNIDWTPFLAAIEQRNVSKAYKHFCDLFEQMVSNRAHKLTPQAKPGSFKGRADPRMIRKDIHQGRIPLARNGDHQPPMHDGPISVRQHARQIRRVQSATQQLRRSIGAPDGGSALIAARETWEAILRSAGYSSCFRDYCRTTHRIQVPTNTDCEDLPLLELLLQHLKGASRP